MPGNRFLSVIAGLIEGVILGSIIYGIPAKFIISGPISADHLLLPQEVQNHFLLLTAKWGCSVGAVIGILGGLMTPFMVPRGHLAKSIGAFAWVIITPLAWITCWSSLHDTSSGRIMVSVCATFVSLIAILPISNFIGQTIESIRE